MSANARCLAHLDGGGLVLTANLRQARILRRLHDQARISAGYQAWPTAQVLPLESWLASRWREALTVRDDLPAALPAVAMRWLWRRLAVADSPGFADPAEFGARARASWLLLRAHGGTVDSLARWPLTRDQQAFFGWARAVERALAERGACDASDLESRAAAVDVLPEGSPPILLVGFRRPTPAQSRLFERLRQRSPDVQSFEAEPQVGTAWRYAAADPESERAALAAWLRMRLAEAPGGVHGLLVPDLAGLRGTLERALEAALQPALELPGGPRDRIFDFAGGPPLGSRAVIEIAIDAIRFALGDGDWTMATRLLRNDSIAGVAEEREPRLQLDTKLRGDGRAPPGTPAALADAARRAGAPGFASAIDAAVARIAGPRVRAAGAWAEAFGACLAAWEWPRAADAESADWQAATSFNELLRELGALSTFAPALTAGQALAELQELAMAPFQPEGGEPAVYVMDGWEDPGLGFDSLWVAGLTAAAWPRPVRIDPFLPIEAQRRLGMPRASAQACVAEAETIGTAWRAQAAALVLSWPQREDDTDVDASPLVPADLVELPAPESFATRASLLFGAATLETLVDDAAPALAVQRASGGARLLELQSRCPFRAFGELRLHAVPLEEPQAGFDRRLRGQVLHRALQRFWCGLGSQAELLALAPADSRRRAEEAVDRALADVAPATVGPRTRALERDWQLGAVDGLLNLDRARASFDVVETEREMTGRIGGLELRLRADRLDDAAGSRVVIDYKTGHVRSTAWRGARMDAPQLPLYAVLHPQQPAAIAIAQASVAGARFVGVGDPAVVIEGVVSAEKFVLTEDKEKGFGWGPMTERWQVWLDALAHDYAAGNALVDPKLGPGTCRHCHLGALCRVDAAGARDDEEEDAGDAD